MNEPPEGDSPPAPLPPHHRLSGFYSASQPRREFVNRLFNEAAPNYDWISGIMSFGSDRFYRKDALRRAGLRGGMKLLDVASGTGLMIGAALELGVEPGLLMGIDPSRGMLAVNLARNGVPLIEALGEALPCADASFDFVCMGYALRHVEDLRGLFGEFHRVLRAGGRVLILEITRPSNPVVFRLIKFYMRTLLPCAGWLRRGGRSTGALMRYYWATIEECVPPTIILSALRESGFENARRLTTGSILSEYVARR